MVAQMASYIYENANGNQYVRYCYFNDGTWQRDYNWLDNDFNSNNPAASAIRSFLSYFFGERVLFISS